MRSIICEASSISKAIEQGWQKAGMPQNFSIKVLEKEEKNFLGMTKKPAKIALFFEERPELQKKRIDYKQNENVKYEKDKSLQENLRSLHEDAKRSVQKIQTSLKQPQKNQRPSQESGYEKNSKQKYASNKPSGQRQFSQEPQKERFNQHQQQTQTQAQAQAKPSPQQPQRALQATQENIENRIQWNEQMISEASKIISDLLQKMNLKDTQFSVETNNSNIRFNFKKPLIDNKNAQKEFFRNLAFLLMQALRQKFKKNFKNLKVVFTCE